MKFLNQCNVYIFLWCIYKLIGTLSISGIVSQLIMAILLCMSLWNLCYVLLKYKLPLYFKGLLGLISLFTIYGIVPILNGESFYVNALYNYEVPSYNYLKVIYMSLLPVFSFYVYTRKGFLTEKSLSVWFFIFFILVTFQYFHSAVGRETGEFTNNVSYSYLALLPMLFYLKLKLIYKYIAMGVIILLVFLGMKRGAILIAILSLIWFMYRSLITSKRSVKVKVVLMCSVFLLVLSLFVSKEYAQNDYLRYRVEQSVSGETSGRGELLETFLTYYKYDASVIQKIIGSGANSTLNVGDNYAHNDWMEILINQGIIGVIIYIVYWLIFYKSWRLLNRLPQSYSVMGLIILASFLSSFFSMSYSSMSTYSSLCLGYCIAKSQFTFKSSQ